MAYVYDWKKNTHVTVQLMCGHFFTTTAQAAGDLACTTVYCGQCQARSRFPYIEFAEAPRPRIGLGDRVRILKYGSIHDGMEGDVVREPTPRNGTYLVSIEPGVMGSYYEDCLERVLS